MATSGRRTGTGHRRSAGGTSATTRAAPCEAGARARSCHLSVVAVAVVAVAAATVAVAAADEPKEDILQSRSDPLENGHAHAGSDDQRQQLGRSDRLIGHRDD